MTPDTDKPTRMTPGEAFDWAYWKDRARAADADRDRFAKRVEVLEAALEPFADIADAPALSTRRRPMGEAFDFTIGQRVEKFTGEARWNGVIVAAYLTIQRKMRYVVEVKPQGFQMIAAPEQLRALPDREDAE